MLIKQVCHFYKNEIPFFQTKLQLLQDEIQRLKNIQLRLEKARDRGDKELPPWLQEHEQFQQLLAKVSTSPNLN